MKESTALPFIISRTFDAPRELVWRACTDPEHTQHWFGPKGYKPRVVKMDFRPGGMYHYCLTSADGHEIWGRFVYREIVVPERIVFISSYSNPQGGLERNPEIPTRTQEILATFTFEEHPGKTPAKSKTTLTVIWLPWNATEEECKVFSKSHAGMTQGWTGTLDQLETYLAQT